MVKTQLEKNLIGISGVYYVAGKLSQLQYIALVTIRNTKAYDLFVFNPKNKKSVPIQVKSSSVNSYRVVRIKNIDNIDKELEEKIICPFILVNLEKNNPEFFVLNKNQMKKMVKKDWEIWVKNRKHYKPIKKTDIGFIFQQPEILKFLENYKDEWKNLGLD